CSLDDIFFYGHSVNLAENFRSSPSTTRPLGDYHDKDVDLTGRPDDTKGADESLGYMKIPLDELLVSGQTKELARKADALVNEHLAKALSGTKRKGSEEYAARLTGNLKFFPQYLIGLSEKNENYHMGNGSLSDKESRKTPVRGSPVPRRRSRTARFQSKHRNGG
ncbi:hypothetical protein GOV09_04020, partial [Candidatus Woesearchaeota archaeon]|nr:hypothetical protein [Candidatus Woesearchaeota archaeon]